MMLPPIILASALAALPISPEEGLEGASLEDLFRWGEYDSLILILEPARSGADSVRSSGLATRQDSAGEAMARMYLGVSYWAKGRQEEGARAFGIANRLDSSLRLDPLYTTPEMALRFSQIAAAARRPDSGAPRSPVVPTAASEGADLPARPGTGKPGRRRAWWTGAAAAVTATGAVAGYYLVRSGRKPREVTHTIDPEPKP